VRNRSIPTVVAFVVGIAAPPVHASTLIADGISYTLTAIPLNAITEQFTLAISGVNGLLDTEKGRYGVHAIAFNKPTNFLSATAPAGFTYQAGGLNSSGCNGNGNFFCFSGPTPPGPALSANSVLNFVFDVTISSGTFAGYNPDFKIDWVGTKNNYDLVSQVLAPTTSVMPLPPAALLFGSALVGLGILGRRRRNSAA